MYMDLQSTRSWCPNEYARGPDSTVCCICIYDVYIYQYIYIYIYYIYIYIYINSIWANAQRELYCRAVLDHTLHI